jgi:hypothetical protein
MKSSALAAATGAGLNAQLAAPVSFDSTAVLAGLDRTLWTVWVFQCRTFGISAARWDSNL